MSWPGARMSTWEPKLEKLAKLSSIVLAPTVMALTRWAGETLLASWASLPAATTKGMPRAMTLATCEGEGEGERARVSGMDRRVRVLYTYRSVNGLADRTTQAHRDDGGLEVFADLVSGVVDAGDDGGARARAVVVHDFETVEGRLFCDAEDGAANCAGDVGAVYDEGRTWVSVGRGIGRESTHVRCRLRLAGEGSCPG
jgi:hypothetical protein